MGVGCTFYSRPLMPARVTLIMLFKFVFLLLLISLLLHNFYSWKAGETQLGTIEWGESTYINLYMVSQTYNHLQTKIQRCCRGYEGGVAHLQHLRSAPDLWEVEEGWGWQQTPINGQHLTPRNKYVNWTFLSFCWELDSLVLTSHPTCPHDNLDVRRERHPSSEFMGS